MDQSYAMKILTQILVMFPQKFYWETSNIRLQTSSTIPLMSSKYHFCPIKTNVCNNTDYIKTSNKRIARGIKIVNNLYG